MHFVKHNGSYRFQYMPAVLPAPATEQAIERFGCCQEHMGRGFRLSMMVPRAPLDTEIEASERRG